MITIKLRKWPRGPAHEYHDAGETDLSGEGGAGWHSL